MDRDGPVSDKYRTFMRPKAARKSAADGGGRGTRVVTPLRTLRWVPVPARRLNPVLAVGGKRLDLDTASLAPVPLSMLTRPMELPAAQRAEVLEALDALYGAC